VNDAIDEMSILYQLYSRIKDRKSPLKGSRPSVPHRINFYYATSFLCFVVGTDACD